MRSGMGPSRRVNRRPPSCEKGLKSHRGEVVNTFVDQTQKGNGTPKRHWSKIVIEESVGVRHVNSNLAVHPITLVKKLQQTKTKSESKRLFLNSAVGVS